MSDHTHASDHPALTANNWDEFTETVSEQSEASAAGVEVRFANRDNAIHTVLMEFGSVVNEALEAIRSLVASTDPAEALKSLPQEMQEELAPLIEMAAKFGGERKPLDRVDYLNTASTFSVLTRASQAFTERLRAEAEAAPEPPSFDEYKTHVIEHQED